MAYEEFDITTPVATQTAVSAMDSSRKNLNALRDAVVTGTFKGWAFTNLGPDKSVPVSTLHSKGTERLRTEINYGSTGGADGLPNEVTYTYSSDGGSSYATVGVQTISYTASSDVNTTSWS
jgi:hypothetical protein